MSKVVLNCNALTKKINNKYLIKNVSFSVDEGDILGFIGPNGAGKTTVIKSILGLYPLTKGEVIINDYNLKKNFKQAISKVGAIIENPDSYLYLTGYENLKLSAKLYGVTKKRIKEVIKIVGLEKRINERVANYSLGMKQRLGIAQAILHQPKLIILDEPTNGLDPNGIIELKKLLLNLSKNKMAIIVSSHILSELETFCNKICIINNGVIIANNTISEIQKMINTSYIFEVSSTNINIAFENCEIIDDTHFKITTNHPLLINKIIKTLINANINIYEIKKSVLSLEEIFLQKTRGNAND